MSAGQLVHVGHARMLVVRAEHCCGPGDGGKRKLRVVLGALPPIFLGRCVCVAVAAHCNATYTCRQYWGVAPAQLLACSWMDVMDSAAMRSAKTSGVMRLPHRRAMELRRGNRRATHVSTIIHLKRQQQGGGEAEGCDWVRWSWDHEWHALTVACLCMWSLGPAGYIRGLNQASWCWLGSRHAPMLLHRARHQLLWEHNCWTRDLRRWP